MHKYYTHTCNVSSTILNKILITYSHAGQEIREKAANSQQHQPASHTQLKGTVVALQLQASVIVIFLNIIHV